MAITDHPKNCPGGTVIIRSLYCKQIFTGTQKSPDMNTPCMRPAWRQRVIYRDFFTVDIKYEKIVRRYINYCVVGDVYQVHGFIKKYGLIIARGRSPYPRGRLAKRITRVILDAAVNDTFNLEPWPQNQPFYCIFRPP